MKIAPVIGSVIFVKLCLDGVGFTFFGFSQATMLIFKFPNKVVVLYIIK